MRVRAEDGDTVFAAREHVGCARSACHVTRTGNGHAAIRSLGAAQAKFGNRAALCGSDHARRLGGNKRLEADGIEQCCLEQLAFKRGAGHAHHGLARKHEVALGHSVDIDVSAKFPQVLEERRIEHAPARRRGKRCQIVDVLVGEA